VLSDVTAQVPRAGERRRPRRVSDRAGAGGAPPEEVSAQGRQGRAGREVDLAGCDAEAPRVGQPDTRAINEPTRSLASLTNAPLPARFPQELAHLKERVAELEQAMQQLSAKL
jgi:hypothetical protein